MMGLVWVFGCLLWVMFDAGWFVLLSVCLIWFAVWVVCFPVVVGGLGGGFGFVCVRVCLSFVLQLELLLL